uniref:Fibrinogen C-terminal domain-containing protein n=2 Tax=Clytia hemisphaerica TaxID=252671 RepID=A0A7M6DMX2_9CNID
MARNSKPLEPPYEVAEFVKFADQKCFTICHFELKCVALLIEKVTELKFQCSLYDRSFHYLTMTSNPIESVFHSKYFPIFRDCVDHYKAGARESGVYQITLASGLKDVRCNMDNDGGGWLVFQRRMDGSVDFYQPQWEGYKNGFGELSGEFWLGNEFLHQITSSEKHEVYIHAGRFSNETKYAKYGYFEVKSEADKYQLLGGDFMEGTDSLSYHFGQFFSTRDKDYDNCVSYCSCIARNLNYKRGGFWYNNCAQIFFNGFYQPQETVGLQFKGIFWNDWLAQAKSLKWTEMMIRRVNH